jgi:hypothetical protein
LDFLIPYRCTSFYENFDHGYFPTQVPSATWGYA